MKTKTLGTGDFVFHESDPSSEAYVIESGHVEITKDVQGQEVRLALLGPGEIFGEMGLVDDKPRSASARARDKVELGVLGADEFLGLLREDPEAGIKYIRAIFERLRLMNARLDYAPIIPARPLRTEKSYRLRLVAVTDVAKQRLGTDELMVETLPLRVGRQAGGPLDHNDLVLKDKRPFEVSRHHFQIDMRGQKILVQDRGSYYGTLVNGKRIGGGRPTDVTELAEGTHQIVVGTRESPFRFELVVEAG